MTDVETRFRPQPPWFRAHPRLALGAWSVALVLVALLLAEAALRLLGERGGVDLPSEEVVSNVELLEVSEPFFTDREGVFRADPNYDWSQGRYGVGVSVNSAGFRGRELLRQPSTARTVLFLGDSFVWGASSEPISSSFVDLVDQSGWAAYNGGIPGTGPAQYAYLAAKYVPALRPDIVLVVLYLGNDIQSTPDPLIPHRNLFHITNAGWIYGFDESGAPLSPGEAYQHYYRERYVPHDLKSRIQHTIMTSVIGKRMWFGLRRLKRRGTDLEATASATLSSLREIREVTKQHRARMLLFLIPAHPGVSSQHPETARLGEIFADFDPRTPDFLAADDWRPLPDGHFNNLGHLKYAEFILRALD